MYEELIQFLLGQKGEFTEEDLDEFIDLLNKALYIVDDYDMYKRQSIIKNMVDHAKIVDKDEREAVSTAIDNILQLDVYSGEVNLFDDSNGAIPLRDRKFKRGKGGKVEERSSVTTPLRSRKFTRGITNKVSKMKSTDSDKNNQSNRESDQNDSKRLLKIEKSSKKARILREEGSSFNNSVKASTTTENIPENDNTALKPVIISIQPDLIQKEEEKPEKNKQSFSKLFSTHKNTVDIDPEDREKGSSEQFKFDIGELKDNHDEGPDYIFRTDDSE